jgi:hypothetical protein
LQNSQSVKNDRGSAFYGFDHGAGHPLLFLDDAKAPNYQKNNGFSDLGNYAEWPKVAGAVIQAHWVISFNSPVYAYRLLHLSHSP